MVGRRHIGRAVRADDGRLGILRDVLPDWVDPSKYQPKNSGDYQPGQPMAFVSPESGGVEWSVPPDRLNPA